MLSSVLLWSALVPGAVAAAVLLLAWRRQHPEAATALAGARGDWAAGVAIGLAYAAGNWGLSGSAGGPHTRLLIVALAAATVGALVELVRLPRPTTGLLMAALAVGGVWSLVAPLAGPQQWTGAGVALRVLVPAAVGWIIWLALTERASRERGPSLAIGLVLVAGGGSAVVLLSGMASGAQVGGALVTALGVTVLLAWRYPAAARMRSAAPVVALLLVGHWTVALLYADMPPLSFALLALAPLTLALARLRLLRRATAVAALVLRLAVLAAPVGAAVATAALAYFDPGDEHSGAASPATSEPGRAQPGTARPSYDEDYGY